MSNRISNKNIYWLLKAPYFADKHHLEIAGRPICGDHYIAMNNGPVPSGLYDIVKDVRDDRRISLFVTQAKKAFEVKGRRFIAKRDANLEHLSKSDIESLDKAIAEIGHLSFATLKQRSHGPEFEEADENDEIPFDAFVKSVPKGELLLKALRS